MSPPAKCRIIPADSERRRARWGGEVNSACLSERQRRTAQAAAANAGALPASHGSFFSKLDPKSRAIHAVKTLKVKSSDQPARAELRIACCVTVVQQEQAQAAAALERQLPSANMAPGSWEVAGLARGASLRQKRAARRVQSAANCFQWRWQCSLRGQGASAGAAAAGGAWAPQEARLGVHNAPSRSVSW